MHNNYILPTFAPENKLLFNIKFYLYEKKAFIISIVILFGFRKPECTEWWMEPEDTEFFIYGNFVLGIAQDEYVPFRSDVDGFDIARIQDQLIDDFELKARNFEIGSNVDQDQSSGPVSLSTNKSATLKVDNSLTIYDSFECPLGATLVIQ